MSVLFPIDILITFRGNPEERGVRLWGGQDFNDDLLFDLLILRFDYLDSGAALDLRGSHFYLALGVPKYDLCDLYGWINRDVCGLHFSPVPELSYQSISSPVLQSSNSPLSRLIKLLGSGDHWRSDHAEL